MTNIFHNTTFKFFSLLVTGVIILAGIMFVNSQTEDVRQMMADAAAGDATISVLPSSLGFNPDGSLQLWLTTDSPVAFARIDLTFDKNLINLDQEISLTGTFLTRVIKFSTMAEANNSGTISTDMVGAWQNL